MNAIDDSCPFEGLGNRGCVKGRGQVFAMTSSDADPQKIVCSEVILDTKGQYHTECDSGIFNLDKYDVSTKCRVMIDIDATVSAYNGTGSQWIAGEYIVLTLHDHQTDEVLKEFRQSPSKLYRIVELLLL